MIERFKRSSLIAAVLALLNTQLVPLQATNEVTIGGCVVQSIELDDRDREVLLHILTDGDPTSIGARVEPGEGVVLDLAGCVPGPGLSGREFANGLVSGLRLNGPPAEDASTAVVVNVRGAFEYSVSTQPGMVLARLSAQETRDTASADSGQNRGRVMEPLPVSVAPRPPLPVLPPPAPSSESPASIPAAQPANDPETSLISQAVTDWALAWSQQRIDDYLAAYATGFRPPHGLSRPAWEALRKRRITTPSRIEVALSDLQIHLIEPGWAVAAFIQSYRSDSFSDQVNKALNLIQEDGRWRILLEEVGNLEDSIPAAPPRDGSEASPGSTPDRREQVPEPSPAARATRAGLVDGARISVRKAPRYDVSYRFIPYPGGDPGWQRGSGVDVVIRAYRHHGIDLQQKIHEDVVENTAAYGILLPDTNIDHRRVRNLKIFMRRHGHELGTDSAADWQPGDIVFWAVAGRRSPDHLGIVSDRRGAAGRPLVIHHSATGGTPIEEDVLFAWAVRGHYRWLPAPTATLPPSQQ